MKRYWLLALCMSLLLTSCLPGAPEGQQEEVIEQTDEQDEKVVISRDIDTSERYFRSVLPFTMSASRGLILSGVDNRLDIDEFETGLMRLAQDEFDPDNYFLRDGQVLSESEIQAWIDRRSENNEIGLNPELGVSQSASVKEKMEAHEQSPKYLSYVLEQNYLIKKNDESVDLGGIAIGVSLHSIYNFIVEDAEGKYHEGAVDLRSNPAKILEEGKQMAQHIVQYLREKEEAKDVPIFVAIYQEETRDSLVPGRFLATATVGSGKADISSWQEVDERHYLFPSSQVLTDHRGDAEQFNNFKLKIEEFFPNFTGVIGRGFYKNGELQKMTIEIPMQFYGKSEVIAFTQYVTDLIAGNFFAENVPLDVYITSIDRQEALIISDPDRQEPYVHIYR